MRTIRSVLKALARGVGSDPVRKQHPIRLQKLTSSPSIKINRSHLCLNLILTLHMPHLVSPLTKIVSGLVSIVFWAFFSYLWILLLVLIAGAFVILRDDANRSC